MKENFGSNLVGKEHGYESGNNTDRVASPREVANKSSQWLVRRVFALKYFAI